MLKVNRVRVFLYEEMVSSEERQRERLEQRLALLLHWHVHSHTNRRRFLLIMSERRSRWPVDRQGQFSAKLPKILLELAAIYNFGPALLMFLFLTPFHFQILSPVYIIIMVGGWRTGVPFRLKCYQRVQRIWVKGRRVRWRMTDAETINESFIFFFFGGGGAWRCPNSMYSLITPWGRTSSLQTRANHTGMMLQGTIIDWVVSKLFPF